MPATYSISVGLPTEAYRKSNINSVLLDLPDNTQKLISPRDVRDAFLSTWANAALKQTIGLSSIEYIGIDSGNPSNRDIKQKIFLGKRNYAGVDIMNSNLLSPTNLTDVYFYNTKPDTSTQSTTRISILAGTNSTLFTDAPYVEAVTNPSNTAIDLNIVNPSLINGPINIVSQTGRVSINGIVFPTIAETAASASNGRILKYSGTYPNGSLRWADPSISISSFGSPGTPTTIFGSPSTVNGYSLEFIDSSPVTQKIGGIELGMSFSAFSFFNGTTYQNWPIIEVMRKLLYPYVPPTVSLQLSGPNGRYASIGMTTSLVFTYSITRYSEDIDNYRITGPSNVAPHPTINLPGYSGLSFAGSPGDQITVTFSYDVSRNYIFPHSIPPVNTNFVLNVSDSGIASYTHSSTQSLTFISPMISLFYSKSFRMIGGTIIEQFTRESRTAEAISLGTKNIVPYPGTGGTVSFGYSGSMFLYLLVPASYPSIRKILDPNGFIVYDQTYPLASGFTFSGTVNPLYGLTDTFYGPYKVYRTIGTCSYSGVGNFYFEFN